MTTNTIVFRFYVRYQVVVKILYSTPFAQVTKT